MGATTSHYTPRLEQLVTTNATGFFKAGEFLPVTPVDINNTDILTGLDLTSEPGMTLRLTMSDLANAVPWQVAEIDVDLLLQQYNAGSPFHSAVNIFDSDHLRVTVIDPVTGEINFSDMGHEMVLNKIELFQTREAVERIVMPVGGQFLLDPNEINGWQIQGAIDPSNTADLGNVGSANLVWTAGGYVFPFPVRLVKFQAWHRNSSNDAEAWGWVIARSVKTPGAAVNTSVFMLDESFDRGTGQFGLRDYGNNVPQYTEVDGFMNEVIPAGEVITLAVGAPTAVTANRYVQVMAGMMEFERV